MKPKLLSALAILPAIAFFIYSCHKSKTNPSFKVALNALDTTFVGDSTGCWIEVDPAMTGASYQWDFGDGSTTTGGIPYYTDSGAGAYLYHAYLSAGSYTIRATAKLDNVERSESHAIYVSTYLKSGLTMHMGGTRLWTGNRTITSTTSDLNNAPLVVSILDSGTVMFMQVLGFGGHLHLRRIDTVDHLLVFSRYQSNELLKYYYTKDSMTYFFAFDHQNRAEFADIHSP